MILSLILLFQVKVFAAENPVIIYKNNSAVDLFAKEKYLESKTLLENETVNNPKVGALHYNLGVLNENAKETDKALQEYLSSAKTTDDKNLQFQANFNAAKILGEKKDIPGALKLYQAALEIRPDSQEVKTNIELLFQGNGGGGGNDSDKDQKSDQDKKEQEKEGNQPQKPQNQDQSKDQKKPAPKPFKSQDLSEQDVRRILDELKRQEEQIRAKMNNEKSKETPVDKDW